jgi:hypothetical protein
MLLRFALLLMACAFAFLPFVPLIYSVTHLVYNAEDNRYEEVDDSPYLIKQPHSLHAIMKQIEWVQKLSELKSSIRQQQVFQEINKQKNFKINRKYNIQFNH